MKSNPNSIPFSLVKVSRKVSPHENRYRARVKSKGTYGLDDVCKVMAKRIHDENNTSTCQFFVRLFESTVRDLTIQGYRVKTNLIEAGLSISGTFNSVDEEFDATRHEVCPTVSTTKEFKSAVSGVMAENKAGHVKRAQINSLMDAVTHCVNGFIVGHVIHLQGLNLKMNPDNPDEGVYLENANGKRVASAEVLMSDRQIINCRFSGTIPPGNYTVRVSCRSGASAEYSPSSATLSNVEVVTST